MVTEDFPWPSLGGGLIRLAKMVEAVSAVGETDLFSLYDPSRTSPVLPSSVDLRRMKTVEYPGATNPDWWRWWMLRRGMPKEVFLRKYDRSPRFRFEAFASRSLRRRLVQHGGHVCLDGTASAGSHHRRSDGSGRREGAPDVVAPPKGALRKWDQTGPGPDGSGRQEQGQRS